MFFLEMKIQIHSDLHIEKINVEIVNGLEFITPSADILILCGDIGSIYRFNQLQHFFNSIYKYFKKIFYIPGNNEYYNIFNKNYELNTLKIKLKSLQNIFDNLIILDKSYYIYNNVLLCGCTLWSYIFYDLPNFVNIHNFDKTTYNKINFIEKKFLTNTIHFAKKMNYKIVVITHYPPSKQLLTRNKLKFFYNRLYYNNLDYLFNNQLTWIYGHTHTNIQLKINNTLLLSNQKGNLKDKNNNYIKDYNIKI